MSFWAMLTNTLRSVPNRLELAKIAIMAPNALVDAQRAFSIAFDPQSGTILVQGDLTIRSTGNLYLGSDQHVIVQSGNDGDQYTHGVWLNPDHMNSQEAIVHEHPRKFDQLGSPGQPDI